MAVVGFVLGIAIVVGLIALYLLPYIIGAKRGIASHLGRFQPHPVAFQGAKHLLDIP